MQLTREADYAIRTMLEVAGKPNGAPATTTEIARRRLVPRPFLRKIVPRLVAAGLIRTRRGGNGGITLARPAREINLLTVVEAAQGPVAVNRCVLRPDSCPLQPTCPVHEICRLAHAELARLFGGANLADLVERGAELRTQVPVGN